MQKTKRLLLFFLSACFFFFFDNQNSVEQSDIFGIFGKIKSLKTLTYFCFFRLWTSVIVPGGTQVSAPFSSSTAEDFCLCSLAPPAALEYDFFFFFGRGPKGGVQSRISSCLVSCWLPSLLLLKCSMIQKQSYSVDLNNPTHKRYHAALWTRHWRKTRWSRIRHTCTCTAVSSVCSGFCLIWLKHIWSPDVFQH